MDAKLKAAWVEALRSGRYSQTRSTLQSANSYCCLGVLCRVAEKTIGFEPQIIEVGDDDFELCGDTLGSQDNNFGLGEFNDGEDQTLQARLARLNDEGEPFPAIADWIEANVPVDGADTTESAHR